MRYYEIAITSPAPDSKVTTYSSLNTDGSNDGGALRVVLDIPFFNASTPAGLAYIKIFGVSYKDIQQANLLRNSTIVIKGGMTLGLPLANPQQRGIILSGSIYQAFGNWQGNEISLDIIASPRFGSPTDPINLSYNWEAGTTLENAVRKTLQIAYGSDVGISGGFLNSLVTFSAVPYTYQDLQQFSMWVTKVSKDINKDPNYIGAQITQTPQGFYLYDASVKINPTELKFTDFIGNATWTGFNVINFKLVLRGDLAVGDYITMPPRSNIVNVVNSFTQFRDNISFQNQFIISRIRHIGDSRQSSADSWCSVIDAILIPTNSTQVIP